MGVEKKDSCKVLVNIEDIVVSYMTYYTLDLSRNLKLLEDKILAGCFGCYN